MKRLFHVLAFLAACGAFAAAAGYAAFYALVLRDLPEIRSLADYHPSLITRVFASDGTQFARFYRERRELVPIEAIPQQVVHAFVAAEDDSFYEHEGLDYPGIVRAAVKNLRAGTIRQGGSTITQQVAKTFLLSSRRDWVRKLKDMILARRIEQSFDKNEILYLYLNQIYLGSGAYGVEAAAQTYFGKSVSELSLPEAALIAGLVPAPSRYTPFHSRDTARRRQEFVLRRMAEVGFITDEQRQAALAVELALLELAPDEIADATAFVGEEVRRYLFERWGEEQVLTGGLQVHTTIDLDAQVAAHRALRRGLREHDRRTGYRGAIRSVPEEEWPLVLEQLAAENGEPPWRDGTVLKALVTSVSDADERVELALGADRTTHLGLEDLRWAGPPDPTRDGTVARVQRVSQALRKGSLVYVEQTGVTEAQEGEAVQPRFALFQEPETEGALVSMNVRTGELQALVGGYSFARSQFDRAVQMRRQPGSAFKPFIYAAALRGSFTPASIVYDTPIVYVDRASGYQWKPENYSEEFYGPITLRQALANSRNVATIRILQRITIPPVLEIARAAGFEGPLVPNLSLALGSSEVTLVELVRAYTTFPAGGRRVEPIFIREVKDREGSVLDRDVPLIRAGVSVPSDSPAVPEPPPGEPTDLVIELDGDARPPESGEALETPAPVTPPGHVVDPVTAYLMTDMLRAVVQEGTGTKAQQLGRPVGAKTGTTNDLYDAWFVGFTPSVVAGVWVGYDSLRNLGKNETGGRTASPIWVDYMERALAGTPVEDFRVPDGVVFTRIDRATGLLSCPDGEAVFQPFREGTAPVDPAPCGTGVDPLHPPRLD